MKPYIGITDVPSAEWLRERLETFMAAGGRLLDHQLHAGVMMSYKTLHGLPTKWATAWPKNEEIADILVQDGKVLNILHYADYPDEEYPKPRTTAENIRRILAFGGRNLDGIQFDMVWPHPELLDAVKAVPGAHRAILQAGHKALEQIEYDPGRLVQRVRSYNGAVDDVLLDLSGGRGKAMNAETLRPFIKALRKECPDLGVTVAGGLGPDSLHLVAPLVRDFPTLSIDAQGQLRTSGSSLDPIEADRADAYLQGAVEMFLATVPTGNPA